MTEKHPENIEFTIDRNRVAKFYKRQTLGILLWLGTIFGSLIGLTWGSETSFSGDPEPFIFEIGSVLLKTTVGAMAGVLMACASFAFKFRQEAEKRANQLDLRVEGAFVRVRSFLPLEGDRDQKIHFRSAVDYSLTQAKRMKRFGLQNLVISTTSGASVVIPGVENAAAVRDQLAEIDAERER